MSMKSKTFPSRALGPVVALALTGAALSGCVYYPDGGYGYGGGYYGAPAYVAPPVVVGGWWGWGDDDDGGRRHWR